ncbi:MAG: hypothetical protein KDD44_03095, partial [Bdellovibrionales bacterium]|nr:hypothetical protein [Bdellovibrionales bacterium]
MKNATRGPWLIGATILLSACSLVYELLIAQVISIFAGNTVVWYSITIGMFLFGMGAGALATRALARVSTSHALFWTEIVLSFLGALAPFLLHLAALVVLWKSDADGWTIDGSAFFGPAIALGWAIGFFTGMELPLLMRFGRETGSAPVASSQLLAADYFGSLIGGVAFSLILWPHFEPIQIGCGIAIVNFLIAMALGSSSRPTRRSRRRVIAVVLLSAMLAGLLTTHESFLDFFLRRYYAYSPTDPSLAEIVAPQQPLPEVARMRSQYHTIDLVQSVYHDRGFYLFDLYSTKFRERPNFPSRIIMFLNGEVQFFGDFEEVYHEFFAHVPLAAFQPEPRRVLVLGGGDGLLVRELVKYPSIDSITLVELDPEMIAFAKHDSIMS